MVLALRSKAAISEAETIRLQIRGQERFGRHMKKEDKIKRREGKESSEEITIQGRR